MLGEREKIGVVKKSTSAKSLRQPQHQHDVEDPAVAVTCPTPPLLSWFQSTTSRLGFGPRHHDQMHLPSSRSNPTLGDSFASRKSLSFITTTTSTTARTAATSTKSLPTSVAADEAGPSSMATTTANGKQRKHKSRIDPELTPLPATSLATLAPKDTFVTEWVKLDKHQLGVVTQNFNPNLYFLQLSFKVSHASRSTSRLTLRHHNNDENGDGGGASGAFTDRPMNDQQQQQ
eukprot:c11196_g1_i1.p1 GENE.c11196_g1_i1~~c11196_g1_i1.p1  ORF type:complete len:232 (-),score=54.06 c11196_g1_i1:397-1092(-)